MYSRLLRGIVWHTRGEPAYRFQYSVWYLGLDLAETDAVDAGLRLLSHNRHNVTSLWDRDYLALSEAAGPCGETGTPNTRTELITVPRILGHAFNPVSFFLQRTGGVITAVKAEVHNTWGERHVYTLEDRSPRGGTYEAGTAKAFYVSPFLPMQGGYGFELREDDDGRLRVKIELNDEEGQRLFSGGIEVRPLPLTESNLVKLLLAYPFVNLKTVAAIHWQGFKLWMRGVEFRANPKRVGLKRRKQLWPKGH